MKITDKMRVHFLQGLANRGLPRGSWWWVNPTDGSLHVYDTPDEDMDKARPTIRLAIDAAIRREKEASR